MPNPSYIRFENTLRDLVDCQEALDEDQYKGCNMTEQIAIRELISLCKEISTNYHNFNFDFDEDEDEDGYTLLDEEDENEEDEDED